MKKIAIPLLAIALLGAGCFTAKKAIQDNSKPEAQMPNTQQTATLQEVQGLTRQNAMLIIEAKKLGIEVTKNKEYKKLAGKSSELIDEKKYQEASDILKELNEKIQQEINNKK